ncbi:MAG: ligase-associated DNA damage response DEXH box helicase [Chitinophagia bacterium]|jgi:ATP-dependent Lhr-like helicase
MKRKADRGTTIIENWLTGTGITPFAFQQATWKAIAAGESGLVNAPTGCGKTYAVFLGTIIRWINQHPADFRTQKCAGLQLIWITPLRALATDLARAMEAAIAALELPWKVGIRNGDSSAKERAAQKKQLPEILIITPESLHLLISQTGHEKLAETLQVIAVDEWHELLGNKRGVQTELAIARLLTAAKQFNNTPLVWGISATIGNLEEAMQVLLYPTPTKGNLITAAIDKKIAVSSIFPDDLEEYPWSGHLGIRMAEKLIPLIKECNTCLIFINTRGMSEIWYQTLLQKAPELAGIIALHHGSIEPELRKWVEDALHTGKLKAVVCTASLDLGVDFRPVDTVIQVGSPKGVARFMQRAGRSGHSPNETSRIYFLPTNTLELLEVAALKTAISEVSVESKEPMILCFDVLLQYCCTLAAGSGFAPDELLKEIKTTHCFAEISEEDWDEILLLLTQGGKALQQYDEYQKLREVGGRLYCCNRRIIMRHRMHIGTIVSDAILKVKTTSGKYIGVIEEWFISKLEPGDVFTLAGRNLELLGVREMTVLVKLTQQKKSLIPSWMGGRMSLSANLGALLRKTFNKVLIDETEPEIGALHLLMQQQQMLSMIPRENELLIEHIEDKEGYHLLVYPFEGRQVHEAISALLAFRIGKLIPISFSISMNDYGFELLSDQPIPVNDINVRELFSTQNLLEHIQMSVNSTEMARRKFRDIAVIGGLIFQGMPGETKKARHLQSSASLLFNVLENYDPQNILLRQSYQEVMLEQMEEVRLRNALNRIQQHPIHICYPEKITPLSFPIIADGLNRNNLSTEKLEDRVKKMQKQLRK